MKCYYDSNWYYAHERYNSQIHEILNNVVVTLVACFHLLGERKVAAVVCNFSLLTGLKKLFSVVVFSKYLFLNERLFDSIPRRVSYQNNQFQLQGMLLRHR